jgi:hypothetical protein
MIDRAYIDAPNFVRQQRGRAEYQCPSSSAQSSRSCCAYAHTAGGQGATRGRGVSSFVYGAVRERPPEAKRFATDGRPATCLHRPLHGAERSAWRVWRTTSAASERCEWRARRDGEPAARGPNSGIAAQRSKRIAPRSCRSAPPPKAECAPLTSSAHHEFGSSSGGQRSCVHASSHIIVLATHFNFSSA